MTVAELISKLQYFSSETQVVDMSDSDLVAVQKGQDASGTTIVVLEFDDPE